jgi:ferric-chelate reductase (NADPH)
MTNTTPEANSPAERPQQRAPGRIERQLIRWMMRSAAVAAAETLTPGFRLITFEGDALRNLDWSPGQKIQIAMGGLFGARTYTPISWDPVRGATRILAYSHGTGPGSSWATAVAIGDSCQFLGPRSSLNLANLPPSTVLFGDETGFGLASSLRSGGNVTCLFEVSSFARCRPVLDSLGLGDTAAVERQIDDAHLSEIERRLGETAKHAAAIVLVGSATSIQRLSRFLKMRGIPAARLRAKAYWAHGKMGLD